MRELALFAGAGGGILGGVLAGWRTVCAVEQDGYAAAVLAQRQNDGFLAPFPIWSDVCTFDGRPWRGLVDVVSGGFPCQDISFANPKAEGLNGARSGLWREFFRIICEVRPRYAYIENSPALASRGLARILADIASIGGDARWCVASASDQGAWHKRERLWLVADFDGVGEQQCQGRKPDIWRWTGDGVAQTADADRAGCQKQWRPIADGSQHFSPECGDWWAAEPGVVRMVHGLAHRVDRIGTLGNGQLPIVAKRAWETLMLTDNAERIAAALRKENQ